MTAQEHALTFLRFVTFGPTALLAVSATSNGKSGMMIGKFNNLGSMATQATNLSNENSDEVKALHYTLNPPQPDQVEFIGDFNFNILRFKGRSLRDSAVLGRRLYMIDFDPVRPSDVCSTAEEKAAAMACVVQLAAWLRENGWPGPCWVDSGDGVHLLFLGDMCNVVPAPGNPS